MAKKPPAQPPLITAEELFGPCGFFCGFCTSYLSNKYQIPKRRGIISYCDGCRPRDKQCSFIKKRCDLLLTHQIEYCIECRDFSCEILDKLERTYTTKFKYAYSIKQAQQEIIEQGAEFVVSRLRRDHGCPKCGEILCIHNGLCYNCDRDQLAIMKNYRNDL
jgi:hypothetical protein